jgi:hypothetical protein
VPAHRPGLFGGFAAVALLDGGQFVGVLGHLGRQLHQQAPALGGADLAPDRVVALARGVHGGIDVLRVAALDLVETWPSDGSITGMVRPDEEGVEALAM